MSRRHGEAGDPSGAAGAPAPPKYPKPRILGIDLDPSIVTSLRVGGYNLSEGTFGTPYRVDRSDGFCPVPLDTVCLPELNEQEVLVINLAGARLGTAPQVNVSEGVECLWQPASTGVITPCAFAMTAQQPQLDRVYRHAGMCIVLAAEKKDASFFLAKSRGGRLYDQHPPARCDTWGCLSDLARTEVYNETGREIEFGPGPLAQLLHRGAGGAEYRCSFTVHVSQSEKWVTLAINKYQQTVAGLYVDPRARNYLLLLPQMPEFHRISVSLIEHFIAEWRPDLFPHLEGARWVHRREYEIPAVTLLEAQIVAVRTEAEDKAKKLGDQIKSTRQSNSDWYTLLRGTGDELVQAVIRSFRKLGFQNIIDVDDAERRAGNEASPREDIQIHDRSPCLVVDVKGVQGHPDDDEARQAEKHATMRMREWKRVDVLPLTIINHQRNLPPRDRDQRAFREEIIANARDTHLGLMTAWDLFKLLRNAERLNWPHEVIAPIFYRAGRIDPVPEHYRPLGSIAKLWNTAIGVMPAEAIVVGDRLAIENDDIFEEIAVESLQVDEQPVQSAPAGSRCGVACDRASDRFREKARVFKVLPTT